MRISSVFIFLMCLNFAQGAEVKGIVVDDGGNPIPFVQVMISGTSIGAETDTNGVFHLSNVPEGNHEIQYSAMGYQRLNRSVSIADKGMVDVGTIKLKLDMLGLNEVVITGTMRETFVKASPVKVEVMKMEHVTKNIPATNLMEGLKLINGVQEVSACGVCNTSSISINGLPGQYSAILLDGSPIYGSLASVYGLNGIPTQMVDRIEIIKGPSSTLYGSEAIAGVLNIITKNPEHEPLVSADVMMTSHKEFFGNAAIATRTKNWQNYTGVNFTTMNEYEDANNDGFGDRIGMDRLSFFSKWSMERPDHKKLTIAAKLYVEDRRNGVESFVKNRAYRDLRGSESIYGESIYTLRSEVFGTYEFQSSANVRLDYSLSWHEQDSYYGSDHYQAEQGIAFTNLIWTKRKGKHTLLGGLTNRFQYYDDNTIATDEEVNNGADRQYIPGIFLEDEWSLFSSLNLLAGMRLDHYHNHGFIPSPRLSVKKDLGEWTTWRLNSGTGFKIVNLFTEDHAFVSGQRSVEIKEVIDPERSWNVSTNLNHTHALFGSSGAIDADVYYTHFTNKITPDYSDPTKIIYANSDGFAKSYGLSFSFSQQFSFPLSYNLGVNLNRTELAEENEQGEVSLRPIEFAPEWSGVVSVNYRLRKWKLDFSYSASINGPMALPEVYDLNENGLPLANHRALRSDPFVIHNIQWTKSMGQNNRWVIYGGVQNISDYRQRVSPLSGFNDPNNSAGFSPYFDTSYAYATLHGREIFLGLRLKIDRS